MINNNNDEIDYNVVLQNLQNYMLTDIRFLDITDKCKMEIKPKIVQEFYIPKQKDTFFWCFYIMKNGIDNYEELELNHITIVTEKQLKIGLVEKLRKEKSLIKTYKFASMTHIENQLVNENKIDVKTFLTLCVLENLNIFYLKKKTHFELLMNDSNIFHVVNLNDYGKYGHKIEPDVEKYRTTLFKIENIEKPIKAISSYKISELTEYCNKLGISVVNEKTDKNKNKNELYESLIQYF
jgi:hypothetical protein